MQTVENGGYASRQWPSSCQWRRLPLQRPAHHVIILDGSKDGQQLVRHGHAGKDAAGWLFAPPGDPARFHIGRDLGRSSSRGGMRSIWVAWSCAGGGGTPPAAWRVLGRRAAGRWPWSSRRRRGTRGAAVTGSGGRRRQPTRLATTVAPASWDDVATTRIHGCPRGHGEGGARGKGRKGWKGWEGHGGGRAAVIPSASCSSADTAQGVGEHGEPRCLGHCHRYSHRHGQYAMIATARPPTDSPASTPGLGWLTRLATATAGAALHATASPSTLKRHSPPPPAVKAPVGLCKRTWLRTCEPSDLAFRRYHHSHRRTPLQASHSECTYRRGAPPELRGRDADPNRREGSDTPLKGSALVRRPSSCGLLRAIPQQRPLP